jgi:hypothetical protein
MSTDKGRVLGLKVKVNEGMGTLRIKDAEGKIK